MALPLDLALPLALARLLVCVDPLLEAARLDLVAVPAEDRFEEFPLTEDPLTEDLEVVAREVVLLDFVAEDALVLGLDRVAVARAIVLNCPDFMMI